MNLGFQSSDAAKAAVTSAFGNNDGGTINAGGTSNPLYYGAAGLVLGLVGAWLKFKRKGK